MPTALERGPAALGRSTIDTLHDSPGSSAPKTLPHGKVSEAVKSSASPPYNAASRMKSVPIPVFVSRTVCGADAAPTAIVGNVSDAGEDANTPPPVTSVTGIVLGYVPPGFVPPSTYPPHDE